MNWDILKYRDHIIRKCEEMEEFYKAEDGLVYYGPHGYGMIAAHELRWIADELDRRNQQQQQQIDEYFDKDFKDHVYLNRTPEE